MKKEFVIKLDVDFPEYQEMKAAIKECKRKWDKDDFQYVSEVTYTHLLVKFPGGYFRIYASEDTHFKPSFDDMRGGYIHSYKTFDFNKQGYKELIAYATDKISRGYKV